MADERGPYHYYCLLCNTIYRTEFELIFHKEKTHSEKAHSEPPMPKVKRIRRKPMNAKMFTQFCNSAVEALNVVQAEYRPTPDDMELMLYHLGRMMAWRELPIVKRKN